MYIHQHLLDQLYQIVVPKKVIIIYGPRRIGKTTLLEKYLETQSNYLFVTGEDLDVAHYLSSQSLEKLKSFIGGYELLVIDEAQVVPNIGLNLKLLVDHFPQLKIIATGSSAFDLANQLGEPLTGRNITLRMYSLSQMEIGTIETAVQTRANLDTRLIYGTYPEVILEKGIENKQRYLKALISDYLLKDILALDGIKKSKKMIQILQLLAFQIGKAVSLSEIGQQVGLNKATVERYIDLLEKSFVLIELSGFSRNLRKEIAKQSRYYFYDLGIRNALINQFNPLNVRNDVGELWENYIIMERVKKQSYLAMFSNNYFWRTYDQQEIDWIEERQGELFAYEMKWKTTAKDTPPKAWKTAYPNSHFSIIHPENYLDFIV